MNDKVMKLMAHLLSLNIHLSVTSALRTPEANRLAGGSPTSAHLSGLAIDIKPYPYSTSDMAKLLDAILNYDLNCSDDYKYDQLIEYDSFVHVGYSFLKARHERFEVDGKLLKRK